MPKPSRQRFYYRNGRRHAENQVIAEIFHGVCRVWHRNGQLAQALRYRHGLMHGVSREWDEHGRLLGSFTMVHGTGLQQYHYDNGQLQSEITSRNGKFHGRYRGWLRDGTLIQENYFINQQLVIRSNLRRSQEDAEIFTTRLANLRQDLAVRQDTSGDKFRIELDGQESNNRGIAGELILRRAEKLQARFGEDTRIGKFAGFDLFLRPSFNDTTEMVLRGQNSYNARVTDTALGTIRSLEVTVHGFEERAERLELDITDADKRVKELGEKVGAKFEREDRYQALTRRQSEIEEKLDLTKNQAPSQAATESGDEAINKNIQSQNHSPRHSRPTAVRL